MTPGKLSCCPFSSVSVHSGYYMESCRPFQENISKFILFRCNTLVRHQVWQNPNPTLIFPLSPSSFTYKAPGFEFEVGCFLLPLPMLPLPFRVPSVRALGDQTLRTARMNSLALWYPARCSQLETEGFNFLESWSLHRLLYRSVQSHNPYQLNFFCLVLLLAIMASFHLTPTKYFTKCQPEQHTWGSANLYTFHTSSNGMIYCPPRNSHQN